MSAGAINYKLGGDASELQAMFAKSLRFAGGFSENLKKALSLRGIFDGFGQSFLNALGGTNLAGVINKALGNVMGGEVAQQRFEDLLGNPEQATAMIAELKSFATKANLSSAELMEQAARMAGPDGTGLMNAARTVDILKKVAEVARGSGGSVASHP